MKPIPLIFEKSRPGRIGCNLPKADTPEVDVQAILGETRDAVAWPEIGELDMLRHFTNLSHRNYGIEIGFYPLGSCTMKYNPKINERTAGLTGFTHTHPMQPEETIGGFLEVYASCMDILKEITGFDDITMQPR